MKVDVVILRDDLADVTVTPSWLARLFGRRSYKARAERAGERWRWKSTAKLVPADVAGAIWIELDDVHNRFRL